MCKGITPNSSVALDGWFHDDQAAGRSARPETPAMGRRTQTLQARYAPPEAPGMAARLAGSVPGHARAQRDGSEAAAAGGQACPRDVTQLPEKMRSNFLAKHAPENVLNLRDEDRLYRWVPRIALEGDEVEVLGEDSHTKILNHWQCVPRESRLSKLVTFDLIDELFTDSPTVDSPKVLAARKDSRNFKPPRMIARDVSTNCIMVSQWASAGSDIGENADKVKVEVTLRELREQGAEIFLVSRTEGQGRRQRMRDVFRDVMAEVIPRHDSGRLIVIPSEDMHTVKMRKSET